jgi:spore coat protein CotH
MHAFRPASLMTLLASTCVMLATPVSAQTSDELFDSSVLHDIQLTMKQSDWETLQDTYLEDTYYPADMKWREVVVPQVGLRSRGSGSRNPRKPGLKVDFGRYLDQTAFGMKSLVLANAIQDPSMLAQRIGLGMFARMGMPAPRVVHARVFVNRDYIGLYQLIEPVDKTFLARAFGQDANGKTENGGYLYEYHWKDAYPWDYLGSDLRLYAELFEAKTHESDAPAVLYGPLEDLFRTLNDVRDNQFEREVGELLDLRQFVRHLAVENFLAEHDGFLGYWGPNNFYLYRFQGRKLSQLLPWDKDQVFWARDYDIFQGVNDNILAKRALEVPALHRTYLETLLECAEVAMQPDSPDSSTGWFEAEIQRTISQIHAAGSEDENKRFDNERFDVELGKVLQFARDRGPIVAHEAQYALKHMSSVAQMSWDGVLSSHNPWYSPIELTQDHPGLRLGSIHPALDMWR